MRVCQECWTRDRKKRSSGLLLTVVIVVATVIGAPIWLLPGDVEAQLQAPSPPRPSDKTEYWAKAIRMTEVSAKVENGIISIPLDVVKEKKIVRFEYEGNGVKISLLSYITDGGKIVTAVSVCEPCRSTRFHIKDKSLFCNACNTEWNLETLKGIQGGCLNYPPDVIPSTLVQNQIQIEEKIVAQWKPRV